MDLSADPYDLALSFCERYNVNFGYNANLVNVGKGIKHLLTKTDKKTKRSAIKEIIFHNNVSNSKVYRYKRLIGRILRSDYKNGYFCVRNIHELEKKVREKYNCNSHHYKFDKPKYYYCHIEKTTKEFQHFFCNEKPKHECKACEVCGDKFLGKIHNNQKWYMKDYCSKDCKKVARIHKRLYEKYSYKKRIYGINKNWSKRYSLHHRQGQLPLITFVSYLAQQKRFKIKSLRSNSK